jgi:hypothetical protein
MTQECGLPLPASQSQAGEMMEDRERLELLTSALQDAVKDRQQTDAEARNARRDREKRRNPAYAWATVLVGGALLAYLWTARPAWVFVTAEAPAMTAEEEEATLRFALYLERNRIDAFQQREGRLPTSLDEAGPVETGVDYLREGSSFALEGRRGALQLRLSAAMDSDSFLGSSLQFLDENR